MKNAPAPETEAAAIRRTIQTYIGGGISGRGSEMKPAFVSDATIHGYIGPDLLGGHIQQLFDWNDQNGPAPDLKAEIIGIDVAGTIAIARVELYNWTGYRFTDMYTLLKADGEWKIVSKVFYLHPEGDATDE